MIRTAELTVFYPYPQARVWEAITGGESNLQLTPIDPETADDVKVDLNNAVCRVTQFEPQSICAMRMRGMSFVTDWSAELSPAENGSTKVCYRQSTNYETKRLYLVAPLIMNPKTQLKDFSREIHKKLGQMK